MQPDSITYTMYRFATCMVTLGCRSLLNWASMSNPTKWTHFKPVSATVGVTLLQHFKNISIGELYSVIWYIDIIYHIVYEIT